jgi:hypothetical protein
MNSLKRLGSCLSIVIGLSFFAAAQEMRQFTSPDFGYSVNLPSSWKQADWNVGSTRGAVLNSPPSEAGGCELTVTARKLEQGETGGVGGAELYVRWNIQHNLDANLMTDVKVLSEGVTNLGGQSAYTMSVYGPSNFYGVNYAMYMTTLNHGENQYEITYNCATAVYNQYAPILTNVLKSFTLLQ